jgi:hypothetical protein
VLSPSGSVSVLIIACCLYSYDRLPVGRFDICAEFLQLRQEMFRGFKVDRIDATLPGTRRSGTAAVSENDCALSHTPLDC